VRRREGGGGRGGSSSGSGVAIVGVVVVVVVVEMMSAMVGPTRTIGFKGAHEMILPLLIHQVNLDDSPLAVAGLLLMLPLVAG